MSQGGSGGGGAAQPSCTTVPLGKSVRRALRAAIGMQKKKRKDKPKKKKPPTTKDISGGISGSGSGSSTELMSSFSMDAGGAAARRESVVRVVLSSGVVEVYPGVVLACTVIQKHPPGLCLAHPDVFRNPHGAVVRPLEPLFPGQKFLLIPWSTVTKLKHKIPESSIGAFADEEDYDASVQEEEDGDTTGSEEATSSTDASEEEENQDHSGGGAEDKEERDELGGSSMPACSARDYFVARERWSECRFKKLVRQGLAVEPASTDEPAERKQDKTTDKKGKKKRKGGSNNGKKQRRERRPAAPPPAAGFRAFATPRRTWEPSLPSVVEEDNAASPLKTSSEPEEEEE